MLPIWLIWNMQLRLAMKISLAGLLGLSFLYVCVFTLGLLVLPEQRKIVNTLAHSSMAATIVKTYELRNVSVSDFTGKCTNHPFMVF